MTKTVAVLHEWFFSYLSIGVGHSMFNPEFFGEVIQNILRDLGVAVDDGEVEQAGKGFAIGRDGDENELHGVSPRKRVSEQEEIVKHFI
jgi:hypothetical protein